jgi:DNA-binding transcriptional MerR regulator
LVSSAFVHTDSITAGVRRVAENQPFTPIVETTRGLLLGTPIRSRAPIAIACCGRHRPGRIRRSASRVRPPSCIATEPATNSDPTSAAMITIGQLAEYVGVTVRAIRHYRQHGLLAEPARDSSGYRRYGAQAVLDLIRIRILSDPGVTLARIDEVLGAGPEQLAELPRRAPRRRGQPATVQIERDAWILVMARAIPDARSNGSGTSGRTLPTPIDAVPSRPRLTRLRGRTTTGSRSWGRFGRSRGRERTPYPQSAGLERTRRWVSQHVVSTAVTTAVALGITWLLTEGLSTRPPAVSAQIEDLKRREEHVKAPGRRGLVPRHLTWTERADLHGSGEASYIVALKEDNLASKFKRSGSITGRRLLSDEVQIYDVEKGRLELAFAFRPERDEERDPRPGVPASPYRLDPVTVDDLDGNGRLELVARYTHQADTDWAESSFTIPFVVYWDEAAADYKMAPLLDSPPDVVELDDSGSAAFLRQRYRRPEIMRNVARAGPRSLSGYPAQEVWVYPAAESALRAGFASRGEGSGQRSAWEPKAWQADRPRLVAAFTARAKGSGQQTVRELKAWEFETDGAEPQVLYPCVVRDPNGRDRAAMVRADAYQRTSWLTRQWRRHDANAVCPRRAQG